MKNFILIKIAIIAIPTFIAIFSQYHEHKKIEELKALYTEQNQLSALSLIQRDY